MKRFMAAAVSLLMTFALATVSTVAGPVSTASAAPPGGGTVYGATGTGQILTLNANLLGGTLNLADVGLASSNATTSSTSTPRSSAQSANLAAAVVGLPLTINTSGQTAPPDNPSPLSEGIPSANINLLNVLRVNPGLIQATNQARWAGDTSCVAGGLLSDSLTTTANANVGLGLAPVTDLTALTLGAANVRNTNALVNTAANAGLNKAVRSTAVGTVTNLQLLNNTVQVTVTGNPTLTATASGTPGGASITSNASSVVVSVKIGNATPVTLAVATPLAIPGLGSITLNAPVLATPAADGTTASGSWTFLTVNASVAGAVSTTIGLLPMTASATAPSGGLDCPAAIPSAPVIAVPTEGATVTTATPTISGTAQANATVNVTVDGSATPITTTADGAGAWSVTAPVLANGAHTATATQTVDGATSPASAVRNFTVAVPAPAAPVILTPADNTVSNNRTPVITGTGVAGATVTVFDGATSIGTAPVDGAGNWTLTSPTLSEGLHTFTATQQAATGPASAASNAVRYTVDITAPDPVTIVTPAQNSTVTDNTPTITGGGAEAGATVIVREGTTELCRVTVSAAGPWSCTPTTPLDEGSHTIIATQTDVAGNVGAPSTPRTFIVDALAPGILTIATPAQGSTVNDSTPTITGAGAEDGATVIVREGTTEICRVTVTTGPGWSCTPTTPLTDGSHTINATQTDAAGNVGPVSADRTFSVDTAAPLAVTITTPAQNSTVTDATPTITGGGAEAGATVIVTEGATEICRVTVTAAGAWSCTPATDLAQGAHVINATQTDVAGNVSPATPDRNFIVDSIAPLAVTITTPAQNSTVTDATPTITGGGAEAGATVIVTEGATEICRVTVTAAGAWSCTPATDLAQGPHTINATQTDVAGNVGPASADRTFTVDSIAPGAVTITTPAQNATVTTARPPITGGGAEAGATVIVTEGATEICRVTVTTAGSWTCTPATDLAQGAHVINASQTDVAGNIGPATPDRNFSVDSVKPVAVTITTPAQNARVTDATPTITGDGAEANATVIVTEGATEICRVTVTTAGTWSCTPTTDLAQGPHTITAAQTDAAGNVGPDSDPRAFIVDTVAPAAVTITTPVQNARVTDATPTITGDGAEAGATVIVTEGATEICRVTVTTAGTWSCTPTTDLAQGSHTIVATQTDAAGNVGPDSLPRTFSVDSIAPVAVTIQTPADGAILSIARPIISGTGAEAGATVIVTEGGTEICRVTVLAAGTWACTPTTDLAEGPHAIVANQTDAAGNVSPDSNTVRFTVDTVAPIRPVITTPEAGAQVTGSNVPVTGTGEAGATISVTLVTDDVLAIQYGPLTATVATNGTWIVNFSGLAPADYIATAFQTDQAGNRSPLPDPSRAFTVVSDIRDAPVITSPVSSTVPTRAARPVLRGTGVAGAVLTVKDGDPVSGVTLGTTTVAGNGSWTLTLTADLADGAHRFTARQAGTNGVPSSVSNVVNYVVDTTVLAPLITSPPNPARTKDNTPAVTGTAEAGALVTVVERGRLWCTATAASNGRYTCSARSAQPNGFHLVTATQRDIAGNVSTEAIPRLIVVDTLPPGAPRITSPSPNSTAPAGTVAVRGTGAPGGTVTVYDSRGVARGSVFVSQNGLWTVPVRNLPSGQQSFTARQIDGAQNLSAATPPVLVSLIAGASGAVGIRTPVIDPTLDKRSVKTTALRISGQGQRGSTIVVTDERGVRSATVRVANSGNWALVFPTSPQGIHRYTATQTTTKVVNGRSSSTIVKSQVAQLRLDTTAPVAPVLVAPMSGDVQSSTLPVFGGTAEVGIVVEATIDGTFIQPTGGLRGALTDNDKRWILKSTVAVGPGTHTLRLVAVDPAGNRSPAVTTTIRTK